MESNSSKKEINVAVCLVSMASYNPFYEGQVNQWIIDDIDQAKYRRMLYNEVKDKKVSVTFHFFYNGCNYKEIKIFMKALGSYGSTIKKHVNGNFEDAHNFSLNM